MSPSDTFYPKRPKHNRGSPSVKRPGNQRKWAACVRQPGTDKIWNTIKSWCVCIVPNSLPASTGAPRVWRPSSWLHCSPSFFFFPPAPQWPPHQEVDKWHLSEQNWIVESLPTHYLPQRSMEMYLRVALFDGNGRGDGKEEKRKEIAIRRREGDWTSGSRARLKLSFTEAVETKERRQMKPSKSDAGAERRAHCRDVKTFNPVPELPVLRRLIKQGNEAL